MRQQAMPPDDLISDLDDAEAAIAERLDSEQYRDDVLRLLFICCHGAADHAQIALALRIVCGLSVGQIARAFLVSESAMEQRITRAKARIGQADIPSEPPGAAQRAERLSAVAAMIYHLQRRLFGHRRGCHAAATALRRGARLAGCCASCTQPSPRSWGLPLSCCCSMARARIAEDGSIVLLEDQDRRLWDRAMIEEGLG